MSVRAEILCTGLDDYEARLIRAAFSSRTGGIRKSKPFKDADCHAGEDDAEFKGDANYVWRMLAFDFIGSGPCACIPVTADFGIHYAIAEKTGRGDKVRARVKMLDEVIKRAESNVSVLAQAGAMRWARAFGMIR